LKKNLIIGPLFRYLYMEDTMKNAKKELIRFIKKLPEKFSKEELIMAIVTEDLRAKGFTETDFEEIRKGNIFPDIRVASH